MHEQEPFVDETRRRATDGRARGLVGDDQRNQREHEPDANETRMLEFDADYERYRPHTNHCKELQI